MINMKDLSRMSDQDFDTLQHEVIKEAESRNRLKDLRGVIEEELKAATNRILHKMTEDPTGL